MLLSDLMEVSQDADPGELSQAEPCPSSRIIGHSSRRFNLLLQILSGYIGTTPFICCGQFFFSIDPHTLKHLVDGPEELYLCDSTSSETFTYGDDSF